MAIAPMPDVVAMLGDMRAGSGEQAVAEELYATVRLTAELGELAGSVYDRQLIAFELDHGGATDEVLASARRSLADRPDAAGHDLVAWALHRLGRDVEAAAEIEAALATGIVDARIQFHAGAIAMARGEVATGEQQLRKALALGPALDPLERSEAETLLAGV
jgi:tetratricopeptide (TPR) repeat protein